MSDLHTLSLLELSVTKRRDQFLQFLVHDIDTEYSPMLLSGNSTQFINGRKRLKPKYETDDVQYGPKTKEDQEKYNSLYDQDTHPENATNTPTAEKDDNNPFADHPNPDEEDTEQPKAGSKEEKEAKRKLKRRHRGKQRKKPYWTRLQVLLQVVVQL
eukprot:3936622-Rhodomonas_salina.1